MSLGMCPPQKGLWDCTHLPLSAPVQHVNHVLQCFLTMIYHHLSPSSKAKPLTSPQIELETSTTDLSECLFASWVAYIRYFVIVMESWLIHPCTQEMTKFLSTHSLGPSWARYLPPCNASTSWKHCNISCSSKMSQHLERWLCGMSTQSLFNYLSPSAMATSAVWIMWLASLSAVSQALTILFDVLAELRGWLLNRGLVIPYRCWCDQDPF